MTKPYNIDELFSGESVDEGYEIFLRHLKYATPKNLSEKHQKLFTKKKFLRFIYENIFKVIRELKPNYDPKGAAYLCQKYLGWYLETTLRDAAERTKVLIETGHATAKKEHFWARWGAKEWEQRWERYRNRQSVTNTFEYKAQKYGMTKKDFEEYNKSRAATLENMIRRHGPEEGLIKWNAYCEKQKYAGCALEYFQEKYGKEEGERKYKEVNKQKQHTLENYIRKYGDIEGPIKYKEFRRAIAQNACMNRQSYSNISQKCFHRIVSLLPETLQTECRFATLNSEYCFETTGPQATPILYMIDFAIPSIKYALEFNGDYWHANPEIYDDPDQILHFPSGKVAVCEIWNHDRIRQEKIISSGWHLDILWESDYHNKTDEIIGEIYDSIMRVHRMVTGG